MTDPHKDLVEAVARRLVYEYEISDGFNEHQARRASEGDMWRNFRAPARSVIAEVARTLENVTPEMNAAWHETPCGVGFGLLAEGFAAMLRASALCPTEKEPPR